jgi:light-regulated signal transduction histidine kinase (bacteriophytochrome)
MNGEQRMSYETQVDGQPLTLDNCNRELVHIPGFIQPHGILFAMRRDTLAILQVSGNTASWLAREPESLLNLPIDMVLGAEEADFLRRMLDTESLEGNPQHAFTVAVQPSGKLCDAVAHLSGGVVILELEEADGASGGQADRYAPVRKIIARMQRAGGLRDFCHSLCSEIRTLTGLDRVMVYRFMEDGSGQVFAEDAQAGLESWLGLHYPEADVPRPVREIYRKIWVRPLPDASADPVPLVPPLNPDTGEPLDMTWCSLRGASVMYTEYLKNMGVAMSLTMALMRDGQLWGLIACHHYRGPRQVSYPVRAACELLAQVASLQLAAAEDRDDADYKEKLRTRHDALVSRISTSEKNGLEALVPALPILHGYLDAGGVALCQDGTWWTDGRTPQSAELSELVSWLRGPEPELDPVSNGLFFTDQLERHYPAAGAYLDVAAGLVAVPISHSRKDWVMWFRPEVVQTVNWAGNPDEKPVHYGPHGARLHPRTSFALWQESVRGRSAPWKPVEIEAARRFRLAILEIVLVHADHLASLNRELAISNDELDSFAYVASHDLKEPLRGIYSYAYYLEKHYGDVLDDAAKERLSSLLRLTKRMDGLINSLLQYSRVGRLELEQHQNDLGELLNEVLDLLSFNRPDAGVEIRVPAPLPTIVCDRVRIREVLLNLVSNAVKYNDKADKWVEIGFRPRQEADGEHAVSGERVFYVRDNGIGIKPRFHEQIFQIFKRLHAQNEFGGGSGAGLTIARKILERHGGHIWLESELNVGTTFFFTLGGSGASQQSQKG